MNQPRKKQRPFVIAEIGMNHDGSFGQALRLIEEAKKAGVQAVKFQLHISEEETLPSAPTPPYFKLEDRFSYFKRTAFSIGQWLKLKNYAHQLGLKFFVSPFSQKAAQILEKEIKIDGLKIPAGEVTNLPYLEYISKTNLPVLASTGMSNWPEIDQMAGVLGKNLKVLFQCSSEYPCSPQNVGLNVIKQMKEKYPFLIIGFSDHTLDCSSAIGALLFGARVFEKHFTLSKIMYGPDAKFSLTPPELKQYVAGLNFVWQALKSPVDKNDISKYRQMKTIFEKSIVAASPLPSGHILEKKDLAFKKPGNGLRADRYQKALGKKIKKAKKKDEPILLTDLE